ncbi:LysM peptidoglycan-binding domain-containing protein [Lacihabitans sp. LS3-19]|uniref:LysM peptidoglycan-binding domain-containing protein n=1 Tax=Lacihabitans sp. LS3-19 TaxID=2487335 RepID=UPI0020CE7159|nr:LysM peptidoglycan-binding domain-containing protein [Lacihabitans sp. LS3-19]MCP9768176.1 LysM peptidoglycan-binding domain-containing protein [Lacihabitans sp. LS3-19]
MEFEERNPKPETPSNSLPMVVLFVLVGIICLLLYAGWHLMSDDASKASDIKEQPMVVAKNEDSLVVDEDIIPEAVAVETETKTEEVAIEKVAEATKEKTSVKPINVSGEKLSYTVKEGETFFGIANRFNVSATTLQKLNPAVSPSGIKVGVTKIIIPIQGYHIVGPGDILKVVAKKYDISVDALMSANNKSKNYAERGEKLVIPKKVKE